jgi:hypothetical protein
VTTLPSEPSERIVLEVHRSSETEGCEVAVIYITEDYASKLLGLIGLVSGLHAMNHDIYQLRVWDMHAEYPRDWDREDEALELPDGSSRWAPPGQTVDMTSSFVCGTPVLLARAAHPRPL